jgi:hypothetical protein
MERSLVNIAVLAGLLGVAAVGGCTANNGDQPILVLKNVHADTNCTTTGLTSEPSVPHGTLDTLFPSDYLFIAQMESRIVAPMGMEDQRTIITQYAKVDVAFPNSTLFSASDLSNFEATGLTHFKSNFSTPLLPNDGIADGAFTLIPQQLVAQVAAKSGITGFQDPTEFRLEAEATFTIVGDLQGSTVESQPFVYGVTLGNHTSISSEMPPCPISSSGTTVPTGYACNPAQDGIVECCTSGDTLTCPATTM